MKWTTYGNLDLWFVSWERTLEKYGFFDSVDDEGKPVIAEHKLRDILNFDETNLSLDGSTIPRRGRPLMVFQDPHLPQVGKTTSKTAQSVTMITGSNAWGEALPPHFQFMTNTQTNESI